MEHALAGDFLLPTPSFALLCLALPYPAGLALVQTGMTISLTNPRWACPFSPLTAGTQLVSRRSPPADEHILVSVPTLEMGSSGLIGKDQVAEMGCGIRFSHFVDEQTGSGD